MHAPTPPDLLQAGGGTATLQAHRGTAIWRHVRSDLPWLMGYALAFFAAHRIASGWGGPDYYSLLFPAAGVRMALLWHRGARITTGIVIVELLVQLASGIIDPSQADWLEMAIGVIRPPIVYGLVVMLVRHMAARAPSGTGVSLSVAPLPLGLASVGAPVAAAFAALPWAVLSPELTGVVGLRATIASLTSFAVGDLLGVLLVTPPLLWLVQAGRAGVIRLPKPPIGAVVEGTVVLGVAVASEALLARIGLGLPHTPVVLAVVLAVAWIGLRFGRAASWLAIIVIAAIVLPYTVHAMPGTDRLALHMSLAAVLIVGYLAGSFADAQTHARRDLERRDRLLFQAERLKTLRAMSVAVIHEISQPLSTLAIEAKHLHEITVSADPEIAGAAALIDRKAAALSTLVRRLRRFGGRTVDEPSPLPLSALIDTVAALTQHEAKAARVTLEIGAVAPDLVVLAQEVELAQAIVNLVRNAIQACDGSLTVSVAEVEGRALVIVANRCTRRAVSQPGMGVGLLVARAIVEAHGGTLSRIDQDDVTRATIALPLMMEPA